MQAKIRLVFLTLPFLAAQMMLSLPALAATKHALLIGVGEYTDPAIPDLRAPVNDVAVMAEAALRLGVPRNQVTVLATGINPALTSLRSSGAPTRVAILAALNALANRSAAGDQVLVYITSHGTQQPDQPEGRPGHDEADGADEVVLPSDASKWDPDTGRVTNGILDDEIGVYVDRIRAKNASVWLVVDSCHSGTALRSAGGVRARDLQYKFVSPAALSIPAFRPGAPGAQPGFDFNRNLTGNLVAFYAVAPEQQAPAGQWLREDGSYTIDLSLLTYAISSLLASGEVKSYLDLAQRVRGRYAYVSAPETPQFEGEFNRPLMGEGLLAPRSWDVEVTPAGLRLGGGQLDFLETGATVRVRNLHLPNQQGLFRVRSATLTSAMLAPVGTAAAAVSQFTADPERRLRAESVGAGVGLGVRVAVRDTGNTPMTDLARRAARALAQQPGQAITLVEGSGQADIVLRTGADRIWIASGTVEQQKFNPTERSQPPFVPCANPDDRCLADTTRALALLVRARRVSSVLSSTGDNSLNDRIKLETFIRHANRPEGAAACAAFAPPTGTEAYGAVQPGAVAAGDCDQLWIRVTYSGDQTLDVTPVYMAVDGSISFLGRSGRDEDLRLRSGESRQFWAHIQTTQGQNRYPVGLETALLIMVEQGVNAPPRGYRWLATAQQQAIRTRAPNADDPLDAALTQAAEPGADRAIPAVAQARSTVVQIPLNVQAR